MAEGVILGQRASYVAFWAAWTVTQWGAAWLWGRWLLKRLGR